MPGTNGRRSDEAGSLLLKTYELLDKSKLTLPELFQQTGIPFYWLRKFRGREIQKPDVNRVQRIYEFLVGRPLKV